MAVATNTLKPQLLVLKKGDFVFEEGDEAIFAYVLTEGVIEIVQTTKGEQQVLGKVEKGTVFGEMAMPLIVKYKKSGIKNFLIIYQKNQMLHSQ